MIEEILAILWLFLPAGFANMAAAMARHLKFTQFLAIPVDGGLTFQGERLLGKNKTVRGFLVGTLFGAAMAYVQMFFYENLGMDSVAEINYDDFNIVLFGALIGFGALVGDAVESFFKRRVGIQPGQPWFPFDQTDYIFGSIAFSLLYTTFEPHQYLWLFLTYFVGHLVVKYVGFMIGVEDKKI